MWIHHIGEIAIGLFILLFGAHIALHLIFKAKKRKMDREKAEKASSNHLSSPKDL